MINRFKKFVCICGICVLSLTTMSFMTVANAEDYVADTNQGEAVYTTAPPADVYTEPVYTQSQEPANNNDTNADNNAVDSYTYAQDYTQAPAAVDNYSNDTYDSQNTASYNFYDDDGDISTDSDTDTNTDTNADSNADTNSDGSESETTTPSYSNVKDIDDTELKDSDWDKISKELSKSKTKGNSSSPFDYIKNSDKATGWDAFINNLNWASTLAIVAFALALICIVIFVIFTIKKIKIKRRGLPDVKVKSDKSDKNGSHAIIEDDEEDNFDEGTSVSDDKEETVNIASHAKPAHGGAEDYGDDYDDEDFNDVHYVKPAEKAKKKKLKQDTSDIIIPNKYKR